jgi:hypothetical protein
MLLGLLFALIFGPGGEAEFVSAVPNLDKEIKRTITEKERKKDLLDLVDAYEGAIKEFSKDKKQLQKKVNQSSGDRNVSSENLLRHYDEYHQARRRLITSMIDYRLMFQDQITEKELMLLIEEAIVSSEKDRLDEQKQEEKTEDELNKAFSQIHDIIVRNIQDPEKSETVTKSFYIFEQTMYNYLDISRDAKADRTSLLLYIDATREELEAVYEQSNQVRYRAANDFAILRDRVIENTTEKEWKQINKELKAFFKS